MNKLPPKIKDLIDLIEGPAKKEIKFIEDHDWSEISNIDKRESQFDLQNLISERNLKALIKLYNLAEEDLGHPTVRATIKLLMRFYTIMDERYSVLGNKYDWTSYDISEKGVEEKMEKEIKFQSGVLKNVQVYRESLRKINFGDETKEINLQIYGDIPIPFMMAAAIEESFPEVVEFLEKKRAEEGLEPKPKKKRKYTKKK